jgi:hypothetical protein
MSIPQISIMNELESTNDNFTFGIFHLPGIFQREYPKDILLTKDFQEKCENFLLNRKFNTDQAIESSLLGSTQESALYQTKNISLNNSLVLDEGSLFDDKSSQKIKNKKIQPKFQIEVNNENGFQQGFVDKLLMNRISARKSRLKKKLYIKSLEEEIARLKNEMMLNTKTCVQNQNNDNNVDEEQEEFNENNKLFLNRMILLEKQEKEVKKEGQKKKANVMKQHEVLQKVLLKEMLVKQINNFLPLKYQIFGEKFIKLIQINEDDSLSVIISKINENITKIKNYLSIIPKKRIKLVIKFHEIYKKLKNYVDSYQQLFMESFK